MNKRLVVFYAYTPFHLFSSIYYAMQVRWNTNVKKILVLRDCWTYGGAIPLLDVFDETIMISDNVNVGLVRKLWLRCLYGGRLFLFSRVGRIFGEYRNQDIILICFSDQPTYERKAISVLRKSERNVICMVEEGEHTYAISPPVKIPVMKRFVRKLSGTGTGIMIGSSNSMDAWIVRHPEMLRRKVCSTLIIRQNDIFGDSEWCKYVCNFLFHADSTFIKPVDPNKKTMLWLSGPLEELGVKEKDELLWLEGIVKAVHENFHIYIKRHPRERVEKYTDLARKYENVEVLDLQGADWIPIEFIIHDIHPEHIITIISSAAFHIYERGFTGKLIYCYPHFKWMHGNTDCLDSYTKESNIYAVSTIDEFCANLYRPLEHEFSKKSQNDNSDIEYLSSIQSK